MFAFIAGIAVTVLAIVAWKFRAEIVAWVKSLKKEA